MQSCKTTTPQETSTLQGDILKKLRQENPLWTNQAKTEIRNQALCSAISGLATTKLNSKPLPDQREAQRVNNKKISLGLEIIKKYKREDKILSRIWNRFNPESYLPNEDNYAYLELQKHLYSLFQFEDISLLETLAKRPDKTALENLTLKDADRLRLTTSYYLKMYGEYQPLTIQEVTLLLLKVNNYDIYKTFGHASWVNYRDVMVADGEAGYANRSKYVLISKFTKPILPKEDDPGGQAYHFWGYASRRLGQGKLVGDNIASLASYYYEQFNSKDDEDHFTDMAGIYFADYFVDRYYFYKSRNLDTLLQIYQSEACFKYNLHNFTLKSNMTATAKCNISKDGTVLDSHLIFGNVYSHDAKLEEEKKCRGLAAMALNKNIEESGLLRRPDVLYYGIEIIDPEFREQTTLHKLSYEEIYAEFMLR